MDDLHIVDGSRTHRDILYLKHLWNLLDEWEVVERAIRFQAELATKLDLQLEVRLWGGPPYDRLKWAPSAACRVRWTADSQPFQLLQITKPNDEQAIYLIEDKCNPNERLYEIHDGRGNAVPILGSELDSIADWWAQEKSRAPQPCEEVTTNG